LIVVLISTFDGVFDGNGHTIANRTYHVTDEDIWKMSGDQPAYPKLAWEESP
jgi:hypothetical protein